MKVQWTKSGKPITANKKFEIVREESVHKLIIHDVTGDIDLGEYSIEVRGLASKAMLSIQGQRSGFKTFARPLVIPSSLVIIVVFFILLLPVCYF